MKAAHSGNVSSWPDGACFAKIAWQQELGPDGLMQPGKFVQVELMRKDAQRYKDEVVNNSAALPDSLPYQPLGWNAITMYADPETQTMATVYGNAAAMQAVQVSRIASGATPAGPAYPAGAVPALVTWVQRDDLHWFGARIPTMPQSVEFVQVVAVERMSSYRRFAGPGLMEDNPAASEAAQRTSFVQGLAPAPLPY